MHYLTASYSSLSAYGINPLTGEACGYCMRVLCDLNEDGVDLITSFLGLPDGTQFSKNWNSFVGGKAAIASVMLDRSTIASLKRYALFHVSKVECIVETTYGDMYGFVPGDAYYDKTDEYREMKGYTVLRNPAYHKQVSDESYSGRNEHQMTGRER